MLVNIAFSGLSSNSTGRISNTISGLLSILHQFDVSDCSNLDGLVVGLALVAGGSQVDPRAAPSSRGSVYPVERFAGHVRQSGAFLLREGPVLLAFSLQDCCWGGSVD